VDDGQQIPAVDIVEQVKRAVERPVEVIHSGGIDFRIGPAVGDDANIIDTLVANNAFMRIGDETTIARRRKRKGTSTIGRLAFVQFQIGLVQGADRIFNSLDRNFRRPFPGTLVILAITQNLSVAISNLTNLPRPLTRPRLYWSAPTTTGSSKAAARRCATTRDIPKSCAA